MASAHGVTLEQLAERLEGVREDVAELRQQRRDDHHRLRSVEASVSTMLAAQKEARESESAQYRKLGSRIALAGVLLSAALVILTVVTIVAHQ